MKKCIRGNGVRLVTNLLKSHFRVLAERKTDVEPAIAVEAIWLRSSCFGELNFRVREQISKSASLSRVMTESAFSISRCTDKHAL